MKIIQVPAGFELMNHSFTVAALTHWATLFGNNLGKRQFINFLLNFIVYFDRKLVTIWMCSIPSEGLVCGSKTVRSVSCLSLLPLISRIHLAETKTVFLHGFIYNIYHSKVQVESRQVQRNCTTLLQMKSACMISFPLQKL